MGKNIAVQLAANAAILSFSLLLVMRAMRETLLNSPFSYVFIRTDTAKLSIFIRGITDYLENHEDLLAIEGLHERTRDIDEAEAVVKVVAEIIHNVSWNKLAGIRRSTSNDVKREQRVALMKKYVHRDHSNQVLTVHCCIHQEALCGKAMKMADVMDTVVKIVYKIRSKGLNYIQFQAFLEELDTEYKDLLYHCEVHWFSRGKYWNGSL